MYERTMKVFITALEKTESGVKVTASNGGRGGPPSVCFTDWANSTLRIGSEVSLTIKIY